MPNSKSTNRSRQAPQEEPELVKTCNLLQEDLERITIALEMLKNVYGNRPERNSSINSQR